MAWTQQHIDDLKEAIASGLTDFQYSDGSRGTYRSLAEMKELLGMMRAEIAASQPGHRVYRSIHVTPRSGY